jgi:UDP-2,3-diacylglucosamine pyrophosphatase LpxH
MENEDDCFNMVVLGNEITSKLDSDKKELYRRALREMQQKRLMNNQLIKSLKKKCEISSKNYLCPICKNRNNDILQASHIGEPIINKINYIVDTYIETCDFYELYKMVIQAENDSLIIVACRKCNKDLEHKFKN